MADIAFSENPSQHTSQAEKTLRFVTLV